MKIQRGYKTEISPNNKQRTNAGAARYAYNWGLSQKKQVMDAKAKIPNAIELHRRLNALKPTNYRGCMNAASVARRKAGSNPTWPTN